MTYRPELETIARIYMDAEKWGKPPQKEVSRWLHAPHVTAGRWVRQARDEGYILSEPKLGKRPGNSNRIKAVAHELGVDWRDLAAAIKKHGRLTVA